jgi:hypothetical protein
MKRTSATVLLVAAAIGGVAGFLLDQLLTSSGRSTFTPVIMLPILLVLIGMLCLALAWPVRRSLRDPKAPHVDPFRALRIAVLAKASSLLGALVGGAGAGLAVFLATRPVVPALGSWGTIIATIVAGGVLVAAALVAEHFCTLPKDPDEREPDDPGAGVEPHH